MKSFQDAVKKLDSEPAIQLVLKRLCDLFALHGILADSGIFLYDGFLSGPQVDMVRTAYLDLLSLIRWVAGSSDHVSLQRTILDPGTHKDKHNLNSVSSSTLSQKRTAPKACE